MTVSQEELDAKLQEYFAILDPLSQSILSEIDNLANKTPNWKKLNEKEQEKIIDSHFVPDEVKAKYRKDPPKTLEGSFPHRLIRTGQKFHGKDSVRDEFSEPFHWETQSQTDQFYVMEPINHPGVGTEKSVRHIIEKNVIKKIADSPHLGGRKIRDRFSPSDSGTTSARASPIKNSNFSSPPMNPTVQHLQKSKKIKPPPPPRSGSMRRMSNLSTNGSTTLSTTQSSYTLPSSATTSPITSESSERFHSLNNTNTEQNHISTSDTSQFTTANSFDTSEKDFLVTPKSSRTKKKKEENQRVVEADINEPVEDNAALINGEKKKDFDFLINW